MYNSGIYEPNYIVIGLGLIGLIKLYIYAIGDPINDFQNNAILSRFVSLINLVKNKKWLNPFEAWVQLNDNISYYKVFFCEVCLTFWLSIIIYYYLCQDILTVLIYLGINILILKIIK